MGDAATLCMLRLLENTSALTYLDGHFHALAAGVRLLHMPAGAGTHHTTHRHRSVFSYKTQK